MKKTIIIFTMLLIAPSISYAVNINDLPGDYTLTSLKVTGGGLTFQPTSFSGRASMTEKGFVMDAYITNIDGNGVNLNSCGFYTLGTDGLTINISLRGGDSGTVTVSYSNENLLVKEYEYVNNIQYLTEYTFKKDKSYYTSTGYTQAQLDLAVSNAVEAKNTVIAQKDAQIASMYTQTQLDQVVSNAMAAKDEIILQKNKTISQLTDMDGDNVTDMIDIMLGLQVLSGKR
ncbi:hypothetical protein [Desulfobacula sp.]|uniref:hypothetical protein n=1 Tax=Desulfobacula sp. TaxID=2593537 RepID=UPI0026205ABA|nr:hypothetical protein [Desulfobacula sp.]